MMELNNACMPHHCMNAKTPWARQAGRIGSSLLHGHAMVMQYSPPISFQWLLCGNISQFTMCFTSHIPSSRAHMMTVRQPARSNLNRSHRIS